MTPTDEISKGMQLYTLQRYSEARQVFESLLLKYPDSNEVHSGLISTLAALKDYPELRRRLHRAMMRRPDDVVLLCQLALCELELDCSASAKAYFRVALDKDPSFLPIYIHLSELEYQTNDYESSIQIARKGIYVDEQNVTLHMTLGKAARMALQPELARRHWRRALHHAPNNEEALQFLAALALEEGNSGQAWALAVRIDGLNPESAVAPMVKGMVFLEQNNLSASEACFSKVVEIDPQDSRAWHQLGVAMYEQGAVLKAQEAFLRAVELNPLMSRGWYNLAKSYHETKSYEDAAEAYQTSLHLEPSFTGSLAGLVLIKRLLCDWTDIHALQSKLLDALKRVDSLTDVRTIPLLLHTMISECAENHLELAKEVTSHHSVDPDANAKRRARANRNRVRIAYLTHDCKDHPMAQLMANVFELHDRSQFEVICYSTGPDDGSSYRKRIEAGVDCFVDAYGWSHEALVQRICDDDVQLLIDLMGHTHGARYPVLARRPAPIQITWLGYPGTTGASYIDYIFVDGIVAPPENAAHFSENRAYLTVYQPNDSTIPFPELFSREAAGLPDDAIVLGCFCRSEKFEPTIVDVWMRLLNHHPKTVLWLYVPLGMTRQNLLTFGQRYGLDESRIFFADKVSKRQHLRRLTVLDLALDTPIYNGHTTTSDALLAGVPVITLAGRHFASRVSASLLSSQGLEECVTYSLDEYAQTVSRLISDESARNELRMKTMQARNSGPLFQTHRIVQEVEFRLMQMIRLSESGAPPCMLEGSFNHGR